MELIEKNCHCYSCKKDTDSYKFRYDKNMCHDCHVKNESKILKKLLMLGSLWAVGLSAVVTTIYTFRKSIWGYIDYVMKVIPEPIALFLYLSLLFSMIIGFLVIVARENS